jgi:hypothetical protein
MHVALCQQCVPLIGCTPQTRPLPELLHTYVRLLLKLAQERPSALPDKLTRNPATTSRWVQDALLSIVGVQLRGIQYMYFGLTPFSVSEACELEHAPFETVTAILRFLMVLCIQKPSYEFSFICIDVANRSPQQCSAAAHTLTVRELTELWHLYSRLDSITCYPLSFCS